MSKPLTDAACRKYAPGRTRRRIRDGGATSLFLVIEPSGHKSWQMRFRRPDGKPGKLTLGPFDVSHKELKDEPQLEHIGTPLSLAAARLLAQKVLRERKLGHDPIADHKARKHRHRADIADRSANAFASAARRFIEEHAQPNTRRWDETAKLLGLRYRDDDKPEVIRGGLVGRWGDRQVASIDGHDIWTVINEARRIGVPGTPARSPGLSEARPRALYAALSSFFGWLQRERRVEINPCTGVSRPTKAAPRDRVLTEDEICWFWQACGTVDAPHSLNGPRPFATILRLLLLTGARLNEVAGMARTELNDDHTMWSIPGSRTKNTRPHVVPLPPLARELIAGVQGKPDSNLIFTTTGVTPVSGWSRVKRRLDELMLAIAKKEKRDVSIAPWRLHDLRRTFVTHLAELCVAPHVIELTVNHVSGSRGGIAGVYNRSELMPERKAALERWAEHVQDLVTGRPANVVALKKARKGSSNARA